MSVQDLEVSVRQPAAAVRASIAQRPVLVAVDFSPASEAALLWAERYARSIGAPLEVLHVIHDPADAPGSYRPQNGDALMPMADVAKLKLEDFIAETESKSRGAADYASVTQHCETGLPAPTILRTAEVRGVQHLVLGSGRRNGLSRMLRGSTANQVAGHTKLPVTIVKAGDG